MKEILRLDATSLGSNASGFLHASQPAPSAQVAAAALGQNRQDTVTVSALAQKLNARGNAQSAATPAWKMSELKAQVAAGSLHVDLNRIADHMMFDLSDV